MIDLIWIDFDIVKRGGWIDVWVIDVTVSQTLV